jgi:hypothetical protein
MYRDNGVTIARMGARQRGMTGFGMLMMLGIVGLGALLGMRIVPIYLDHFVVKSSMQALKQDLETRQMSAAEVRQTISRRFDINNVTHIGEKDVKIRQNGQGMIVELAYEDRRPLIGNLEVVAKFSETVVLSR